MGFDGFISYSHAADGRLAPAVQRGLHSLAKPWHRRRALWIFRDQTGLAVTPTLWSSIQNALNSSEYFVLMASPEAAQSPWVNKEIRHWVQAKSPERILPVVTDGEWQWDAEANDFTVDSTAVPAALRGVFTEEPLYLDLRWARDDGQLSLRHSRFRDAIAQLASPMHGVSKDELEGEDVRLHRRARRLRSVAVAGLAVLTLVASLTGVLAVRYAGRANTNAAEAVLQQQRAAEQESIADRSADEANRQLENAQLQEARAKTAVDERRRQEKRAQQQRALANEASAEAARQQVNARQQQSIARTQQQAAQSAAKRARAQQDLARRQSALAKKAGAQAREQTRIAQEQAKIAADATAEAERQKRVAERQKKLAEQAEAEAKLQQEKARKQQQLAEEAEAEPTKQKANAEQQHRIATGRRINNQAKAIINDDPRTALRLGTAAAQVQGDEEARRQLAGLVASTRYAGTLEGDIKEIQYSTNDVLINQQHDGGLTLWNVSNRARPELISQLGRYRSWAISPDGRTVAAAEENEPAVALIDVTKPATPQVLTQIPVASQVFNVTWNQDGSQLFVGAFDETAADVGDLWNVSDLRLPQPLATQINGSRPVTSAAFSPDSNTLATTNSDNGATIWNLTDPTRAKQIAIIDGPLREPPPPPLDDPPPADPPLELAEPGLRTTSTDSPQNDSLHAFAFLRDRPTLIAAIGKETRVFDLSNPEEPTLVYYVSDDAGEINSVNVSSDGRHLAIGNSGGQVTLFAIVGIPPYDDVPGKVLPPLPGLPNPSANTFTLEQAFSVTGTEGAASTALSPDGTTLITASGDHATLWDVTPYGSPVLRAGLLESDGQILASAYSASGSMVTVGGNAEVGVWDVAGTSAPAEGTTTAVHAGPIHLAALTPDARTVAIADPTGKVRVSDLTNPAQPVTVAEFDDPDAAKGRADELVISPDGETLGIGRRQTDTVVLWNVTAGRTPTRHGPVTGGLPLAFSPDGHTFALRDSAARSASLWTLDGPAGPARLGELGKFNQQQTSITAIAFSPDGRTVAMGGSNAAGIWDISTPLRPRPSGRFANVKTLESFAFSNDGRKVAALDQSAVEIWELGERNDPVRVAAATLLTQRPGPTKLRHAAGFSPDGQTLATGLTNISGRAKAVALWDLKDLAELRADPSRSACAMAHGGLSEDDWTDWLPEVPYEHTC